MRLKYISQEDAEILEQVYGRVGNNLFSHSEVSDLVKSQQFWKRMHFRAHVDDKGRHPGTRIHLWKLSEGTLKQLGGKQ